MWGPASAGLHGRLITGRHEIMKTRNFLRSFVISRFSWLVFPAHLHRGVTLEQCCLSSSLSWRWPVRPLPRNARRSSSADAQSPAKIARATVLTPAEGPPIIVYAAANQTGDTLDQFTVMAFVFKADGTLKARQTAPGRRTLDPKETKYLTLVLDGSPVEPTDVIVVGIEPGAARRLGGVVAGRSPARRRSGGASEEVASGSRTSLRTNRGAAPRTQTDRTACSSRDSLRALRFDRFVTTAARTPPARAPAGRRRSARCTACCRSGRSSACRSRAPGRSTEAISFPVALSRATSRGPLLRPPVVCALIEQRLGQQRAARACCRRRAAAGSGPSAPACCGRCRRCRAAPSRRARRCSC